jgi:hypothetical protein
MSEHKRKDPDMMKTLAEMLPGEFFKGYEIVAIEAYKDRADHKMVRVMAKVPFKSDYCQVGHYPAHTRTRFRVTESAQVGA